MKEPEVRSVTMAETKPNYRTLAVVLLDRCRDFYKDPENERAFQEWKAGKEGKRDE